MGLGAPQVVTAMQTRMKANRVPAPTSLPSVSIGVVAATMATPTPMMSWLIHGVPSRGWTRANTGGSSPSLAMVAKMRLWP